jgi:hypothetical protein
MRSLCSPASSLWFAQVCTEVHLVPAVVLCLIEGRRVYRLEGFDHLAAVAVRATQPLDDNVRLKLVNAVERY